MEISAEEENLAFFLKFHPPIPIGSTVYYGSQAFFRSQDNSWQLVTRPHVMPRELHGRPKGILHVTFREEPVVRWRSINHLSLKGEFNT